MSLLWTLFILAVAFIAYMSYRLGRFVERAKHGS